MYQECILTGNLPYNCRLPLKVNAKVLDAGMSAREGGLDKTC